MDETPEDQPWLPDEHLVDAVLAGGKRDIRTFSHLDRCWLVAGLGARGLVAEDIADRLTCSLRTIRKVKAQPECKAFVYAQTETSSFRNELALVTSALRNTQSLLATSEITLSRTREKLDRLIDARIAGCETCARCGTPWDAGNTYYESCPSYEGGRKRRCRNCNRLKQQAFRARSRTPKSSPTLDHLVGEFFDRAPG